MVAVANLPLSAAMKPVSFAVLAPGIGAEPENRRHGRVANAIELPSHGLSAGRAYNIGSILAHNRGSHRRCSEFRFSGDLIVQTKLRQEVS